MPPVEETLTSYLSQNEASSWKAPVLLSKTIQTTSWMIGKANVAAGQACGALHTMAVLQAYQANLLRDLDCVLKGSLNCGPPCHETDRRHYRTFDGGNGGYGEAVVGSERQSHSWRDIPPQSNLMHDLKDVIDKKAVRETTGHSSVSQCVERLGPYQYPDSRPRELIEMHYVYQQYCNAARPIRFDDSQLCKDTCSLVLKCILS